MYGNITLVYSMLLLTDSNSLCSTAFKCGRTERTVQEREGKKDMRLLLALRVIILA